MRQFCTGRPTTITALRSWLEDWGYWIRTGPGLRNGCIFGSFRDGLRESCPGPRIPKAAEMPPLYRGITMHLRDLARQDRQAVVAIYAVYARDPTIGLKDCAKLLSVDSSTLHRRRVRGEKFLLVWYRQSNSKQL